jgi:hypothetical protein
MIPQPSQSAYLDETPNFNTMLIDSTTQMTTPKKLPNKSTIDEMAIGSALAFDSRKAASNGGR